MTLVVDASVALKWFVPEPLHHEARGLRDAEEDLAAPDLLLAEVANALWRKAARGEIGAEQCRTVVRALEGGVPELHPLPPLVEPALDLAHELGHPLYECLYLALAERVGGTVVTADHTLLEAARRRGIPARGVADLRR